MERETKKIITPISKAVLEIKTWVSGREKIQIQSVYTNDLVYKQGEEFEIKGDKFVEAKKKAIEMIVVSVNDSKENIVDTVLDLRSTDYDFAMNEIDKITSEEEEDKKKQ